MTFWVHLLGWYLLLLSILLCLFGRSRTWLTSSKYFFNIYLLLWSFLFSPKVRYKWPFAMKRVAAVSLHMVLIMKYEGSWVAVSSLASLATPRCVTCARVLRTTNLVRQPNVTFSMLKMTKKTTENSPIGVQREMFQLEKNPFIDCFPQSRVKKFTNYEKSFWRLKRVGTCS